MALAVDLSQTSRLLLAAGDLNEASRLASEGAQIVHSVLQQNPGHHRARSLAARFQWTRASLDMRRGQLLRSQENFRATVAILRELTQEGDSLLDRLWLVKAFESLGQSYQQSGDSEFAADSWNQGLEVARELADAEPSPDHLALLASMLILSQNESEAAPIVKRLAAMGYRNPTYVDLLDRLDM